MTNRTKKKRRRAADRARALPVAAPPPWWHRDTPTDWTRASYEVGGAWTALDVLDFLTTTFFGAAALRPRAR